MKKLIFLAALAMGVLSCNPIIDVPEVQLEENSYTVSKDGGELTIPVSTTGLDDIEIDYIQGHNKWEVIDPATGDRIPTEGWIKVVKIIENYGTRDLPVWRSGIVLEIAPNNSHNERVATITIESFSASKTATIKQGF